MTKVIIYQTRAGALQLRGDIHKETIWANLDQISNIFNRHKSVISRHIKNIFHDGELKQGSVVAFFATTAKDGKKYSVEYFNLDVILSVGYRVNSKQATTFRQWATKILRQHIIKGYTINRSRIADNYAAFQRAVENIQTLLPEQSLIGTKEVLDLVKEFAVTWVSLDAYDKETLIAKGATKKSVSLTGADLLKHIFFLKESLIEKTKDANLFAIERNPGSIEGIIGNVMQSFNGQQIYPTVEEKAAHLLYFMVKNHPFIDGNKRCGAYAFIWFLNRNKLLDRSNISPSVLTVLTLFIAESQPKNKERMIRLILQLLKK